MKNKILKISILVIMLVGGMLLLAGCTDTTNTMTNTTVEKNTTVKKEVGCEHDWVTTSRYDFWTNTYKIISKCSECGQVVE